MVQQLTTFRDSNLDMDSKTLSVNKVLTVYEIRQNPKIRYSIPNKVIVSETITPLIFPLKLMTKEELLQLKKQRKSLFVLKIYNDLWVTEIPKELSLMGSKIGGEHLCAKVARECSGLCIKSPTDVICSKISRGSTNIELFKFITFGWECWGNDSPSFRVLQCKNYRSRFSPKPPNERKRKNNI